MNRNLSLHSEKGSVLTTVLIAVGLMAVVALGGMQVIGKSFESTRVVEQRLGVVNISQDITGVLKNSAACKVTLGEIDLQADLPRSYTEIRSESGDPLYVVGQSYEGGRLKVKSITLKNHVAETSTEGRATMEMVFEKVGLGSNEVPISREVVLSVNRLDVAAAMNRLSSCYALANDGTEGVWRRLPSKDIYLANGDRNVGIGIQPPQHPLDILTELSHGSQLRLSVVNPGLSDSFGVVSVASIPGSGGGPASLGTAASQGAWWNGANWVASESASSHITLSAGAIHLRTASGLTIGGNDPLSSRVVVLPDGKVGIGTIAPGSSLELNGGGIVQSSSYPNDLLTNNHSDGQALLSGILPPSGNSTVAFGSSSGTESKLRTSRLMVYGGGGTGGVAGIIKQHSSLYVGDWADPSQTVQTGSNGLVSSFTGMHLNNDEYADFLDMTFDDFNKDLRFVKFSDSALDTGHSLSLAQARGTLANLQNVHRDDQLGEIRFAGATNSVASPGIQASVDAAVISGSVDDLAIQAGGLPGRLSFYTQPSAGVLTENMTIDAEGRVGIGTHNPSSALHVDGRMLVKSPSGVGSPANLTVVGGQVLLEGDSGTLRNKTLRMDNGYFQIKDHAFNEVLIQLGNNGDLFVFGTVTQNSDSNLKKDVAALDGRKIFDRLLSLRPVRYVWRNPDADPRFQYGLIAQEVEQTFPELVNTEEGPNGTKSVNYLGLVAPILAAVKYVQEVVLAVITDYEDLQTQVHEAKHRLNRIKQQRQMLLERIDQLEKSIQQNSP